MVDEGEYGDSDQIPVSAMRSRNMSAIRGQDTKPELTVRKMLHQLGYRFRLHRRDLPGTPDIVLPKYRTVIFVHGCFWHRHPGCRLATNPRTRSEFWKKKFRQNIERDKRQFNDLAAMDWKVLIVWECELKNIDTLRLRLLQAICASPRQGSPAGSAASNSFRVA